MFRSVLFMLLMLVTLLQVVVPTPVLFSSSLWLFHRLRFLKKDFMVRGWNDSDVVITFSMTHQGEPWGTGEGGEQIDYERPMKGRKIVSALGIKEENTRL